MALRELATNVAKHARSLRKNGGLQARGIDLTMAQDVQLNLTRRCAFCKSIAPGC